MATGGNQRQIQVNLDVQRLADAITNRIDLFVLIPNSYEGDPRKFRDWIKQIEKYAFMTELNAAKVKLIAYKTSAGPVSDFIKRYITNNSNNTWNQLKVELTMRFGEISDSDQALKMLREIKQYRDENVQWYAERLLSLASEAYNNQPGGVRAADMTLVGHFTDGLYFDYLQFRMLREKPQTLQEAMHFCIEEQNLRNYLEQGLAGIMVGKIQVILGLMNPWRSICIGHPVNVNFVFKMAILQGTVKVKKAKK